MSRIDSSDDQHDSLSLVELPSERSNPSIVLRKEVQARVRLRSRRISAVSSISIVAALASLIGSLSLALNLLTDSQLTSELKSWVITLAVTTLLIVTGLSVSLSAVLRKPYKKDYTVTSDIRDGRLRDLFIRIGEAQPALNQVLSNRDPNNRQGNGNDRLAGPPSKEENRDGTH
jgi:hypothetical protein